MSATFTAEATGRGQYTWIWRQQRDGKSKVNTLFLLLTRSAASAERQFAIYIKRSSSQLLKLETKSRKKSQVFMSKWHEFFRAIAQRMNSTWEPRERRQWHYTAMIFNSKFSICCCCCCWISHITRIKSMRHDIIIARVANLALISPQKYRFASVNFSAFFISFCFGGNHTRDWVTKKNHSLQMGFRTGLTCSTAVAPYRIIQLCDTGKSHWTWAELI